jgi:hypothetical protein
MTSAPSCLTINAREATVASGKRGQSPKEGQAASSVPGQLNMHYTMSKTLDVIIETIRDPRHPFRKLGHQPKKALKNRYERRKIKEFLHIPDLQAEEAV